MERRYRGTTIRVLEGDIAAQIVDVIVHFTSQELGMGGSSDDPIHRVGGPRIQADDARVMQERAGKSLRPGDAALTEAGLLHARYVAHAILPRWLGGAQGENAQLERAYRNAIDLAVGAGCTTIAFPSAAAGRDPFCFPVDRAAFVVGNAIARACEEHQGKLAEIRFVAGNADDFAVYGKSFGEVLDTMTGTSHLNAG